MPISFGLYISVAAKVPTSIEAVNFHLLLA